MTVVKFHSKVGEIYKIFVPKWRSSMKIFFTFFKTFWLGAVKKWLFVVFGANFQGLKSIVFFQNLFCYQMIEIGNELLSKTLSTLFISKHGLFSKVVLIF